MVSCLTRPPPVSRTKAPSGLYFRGSITRPLTSLSTLRRVGHPTTTQDSLLAAGPALPSGIRTRRVSTKGFQSSSLVLLSKAFLTQGHHTYLAGSMRAGVRVCGLPARDNRTYLG